MPLVFSGLLRWRSQTCRFSQLAQLSPLDADQPFRKRRGFRYCSHCSTERKNGGGDDGGDRARVNNDQSPTASGANTTALTLYAPNHAVALLETNHSSPSDALPSLRLSTMPRTIDREPSKWQQLTIDQLETESDVGHLRNIGSKLVDSAEHMRDRSLWKELLLYRQRHYGDRGTIDIWKGMRERCRGVELPVVGDDASFFWRSFVTVGLKRSRFLDELMEYAQDAWSRKKRRWHGLYGIVVGGYLEMSSVRQALKWHWILKRTHLCDLSDISRVFGLVLSSKNPKNSLKAFRSIVRTTEGHKIYSYVVPRLWRRNMVDEAVTMHHLLVQRNDGPQTIEETVPLFQHVQDYGSKKDELNFLREMVESGSAHKEYWEKLLRYAAGENNKVAAEEKANKRAASSSSAPEESSQTKFTDDFGARLFATRAFSFELIVAGMEMFSVQAIGPLTLRQMALRASNVSELAQQITELKRRGISIRECVFCQVVQELVTRGDGFMLRDVLHGDQHPDVMEDLDTQELLFSSYTLSQDSRRANMTFMVLSVLSNEDTYNLNIHFRNAVNTRRWSATAEIIELMNEQNISLSKRSVMRMTRIALPLRRPGRRPQTTRTWFMALWNLLGTFQYVAKCGSHVLPGAWKEGLKRLGMAGRLTQLEKLCIWIVEHYSSVTGSNPAAAGAAESSVLSESHFQQMSAAQARYELRMIFTLPFQQGVIAWGFGLVPPLTRKLHPVRNPGFVNGETIIPWVRGIALLRQLKEKGVFVHEYSVKKACRHRLAVLFGNHRLSNRKKNRTLRQHNPYTLEEVLVEIDKAWGRPLFHDFHGTRYQLVNPRIRSYPPRDTLSDGFLF